MNNWKTPLILEANEDNDERSEFKVGKRYENCIKNVTGERV